MGVVRPKNSTYVGVMLNLQEKDRLDAAAAAAGTTRNRLIRDWIATLPDPEDRSRRDRAS